MMLINDLLFLLKPVLFVIPCKCLSLAGCACGRRIDSNYKDWPEIKQSARDGLGWVEGAA